MGLLPGRPFVFDRSAERTSPRMGSIGVRCMFGTKVEEEIAADYIWHDCRPRIGDTLLTIGSSDIHERSYSDYIRALRRSKCSGWRDGRSFEWRDQHSNEIRFGLGQGAIPPFLDVLPLVPSGFSRNY